MPSIKLQEALKAVEGTKGNHLDIAKNLGCARSNISHLRKKWAKFDDAVKDAKEARTDWVEGKLDEKIEGGDTTAIIFYLKTQGKERGYDDKKQVEHIGEIKVKGYVKFSPDDWDNGE